MQSVKLFYNKYNYPKVNQFTPRQRKHHVNIMNEILGLAGLSLSNIKNKRILDAGCGTGDKSVLLAKSGAIVTAIDFSEGQLKEAKLRAQKEFGNKSNIKFSQKDLIKDDLSDLAKTEKEKFDLIICLGVLHHTENPKLGFNKLVKLLNKKGIIILGLYHKYSRLKYKLFRSFIHLFVSRDPERIMLWLRKSFIGKLLSRGTSEPTLYDRYCVPYESYHTLNEVIGWFNNASFDLIGYSDNAKGFAPFKILNRKTIFFVAGRKRLSKKELLGLLKDEEKDNQFLVEIQRKHRSVTK